MAAKNQNAALDKAAFAFILRLDVFLLVFEAPKPRFAKQKPAKPERARICR
jgi:hypothetical protein